jgi:glucose/arabinose dehydrogenase
MHQLQQRLTSTSLALVALVMVSTACDGQKATTSAISPGDTSALAGKLTTPSGFSVSYFAKGLSGVRFMTMGPDGAVYASRMSANEIVRLVDANGDGVADSSTVAVSGLNRPHGLAFHNGWLYIGNTDAVVRVKLDANGKAIGTPERVAKLSTGGGHSTRTVIFGPDNAMYVSVGSSCNLCVETDSLRATVTRFDENGAHGEVFSRGLRNAVGMALNPTTHEIWVTQNERDNLPPNHENLPPEEINILKQHGDYGWPYCYAQRVPNPEYPDQARCNPTIGPALEMQAHSAPLGITFLDKATNFPESYRGDALVAFHGSWNRSAPTGAKVVRVHVQNGKPTSYEDFVTGWQEASGQRWGRPVDVMVYKDGSVLISDDQGGVIYRVTHTS